MPIIDNINVDQPKKRRKTHALILLDETGSMAGSEKDTVDGINEHINHLKIDRGDDVLLTLVKFDSTKYQPIYSATPIENVKLLKYEDYQPGAATNLFDSIGRLITTADEGGADAMLCIIMTDGMENASKEFTKDNVKSLIEKKRKQDKSWVFTFLGADMDAYSASGGIGIAAASTVSVSKANLGRAYGMTTNSMDNFRTSNAAGSILREGQLYSDEDKKKVEEKGE